MEMYVLPDGTAIPFTWVIGAIVAPLVLLVVLAGFALPFNLFLGMLAAMAVVAGFVYAFSRGTDWMEPLELDDEDYL